MKKIITTLYGLILGVLLISRTLSAQVAFTSVQAPNYQFQHFTIEDGLSKIGTFAPGRTLEDQEGFMWWATMDGLVRYDGRTFKKFRYSGEHPHSLGSNQTTAICQAADGKIWVGTGAEGIFIFDPTTEHFTRLVTDAKENDLSDIGIAMMERDQAGNIWIGTRSVGVYKYNPTTQAFTHYQHPRDGIAFLQQTNGTIWIGHSYGLAKYLPTKDSFQSFSIDGANASLWQENRIFDLAEDGLEQIWLTSDDIGPHIFDVSKEKFSKLALPNSIKPGTIASDQQGNIWLAGNEESLFFYDTKKQLLQTLEHDPFILSSCPKGYKTDLFVDSNNHLWVTILEKGISKLKPIQNPFEQFTRDGITRFIPLDDTTVLFQNNDYQVLSIHTPSGQLRSFPIPKGGLPPTAVFLLCTPEKDFYFSDVPSFSTHVWNRETGKSQKILLESNYLAIDAAGDIWCNNDLWQINPTTKEIINKAEILRNEGKVFPKQNIYLDILVDQEQKIWLSTDNGGLWMYDPIADTTASYRHDPTNPYSIASDVIYDLYLTRDNRIAAGTIHGLSILDKNRRQFQNITESDGLAHNEIKGIVQDNKGNIWVSTAIGISCIESSTNRIKNYDTADGVPKGSFHAYATYRDQAGYLYFGMTEGGIRFHPDHLSTEKVAAPIHLLDFYLKKEVVTPMDSSGLLTKNVRYLENLNLSHQQGDFGLSFTMPVFEKNDKIIYSYQLEGYEATWNTTSDNFAHFTNIQPGKYTFHVKVTDNDDFVNTQTASIAIQISPPLWKTWWAYLLYIGSFLAITYSIYRFNLSRQLAKAETVQLKEMDELKTRFFTNITHEFRTPLTVIMGINENINGHSTEKQLIRRNSKNLLRLVNQLLDISKAEFGSLRLNNTWGDIITYLQYITESFSSKATDNGIKLMYYAEEERLDMLFDEGKVQQVLYNLLSNALKYTKAEGKIIVHVQQTVLADSPALKIKIKDTGVGIPEEVLPNIFNRFYQVDNSSTRQGEGTGIGLALVKELVTLMKGKISVESTVGKGTQFTVLLPIQQTKDKTTPLLKIDANKQETIERAIADETVLIRESAAVLSSTNEPNQNTLPILLLIEDNRDVALYIESILKKDYQLYFAKNGQLGIDQAIELVPDIIISDVMMPIKDGYEVCETLKTDERTSHIPIILLTAKATQSDRITGLKYGADAYLTKPFDKQELLLRLEKLVAIRQQLQQYYANTTQDAPPISAIQLPLEDAFLAKLQTYIDENMEQADLGVAQVSKHLQMSRSQVYRKLNALTGKSVTQLIRETRLAKGKALLLDKALTVAEIAYQIGFTDPNYFSRAFQQAFGTSPTDFRK